MAARLQEIIAQTVRDRRRALGMSQRELAEAVGFGSHQIVSEHWNEANGTSRTGNWPELPMSFIPACLRCSSGSGRGRRKRTSSGRPMRPRQTGAGTKPNCLSVSSDIAGLRNSPMPAAMRSRCLGFTSIDRHPSVRRNRWRPGQGVAWTSEGGPQCH